MVAQVQYFNIVLYFKFSNKEDRLRVLEASPIIIKEKPFIVTPWSLGVGRARDKVLSIPVWATFTHIPIMQPLIGPNWLASLIGELKCFDASAKARKSLRYARALIEIISTKPLPSKMKVGLAEGLDMEVDVQYSWKSDICSTCQSFGHTSDTC